MNTCVATKGAGRQRWTPSKAGAEGPGRGGGERGLYPGIINLFVVIYAGVITGGRGVRAWGRRGRDWERPGTR